MSIKKLASQLQMDAMLEREVEVLRILEMASGPGTSLRSRYCWPLGWPPLTAAAKVLCVPGCDGQCGTSPPTRRCAELLSKYANEPAGSVPAVQLLLLRMLILNSEASREQLACAASRRSPVDRRR